MIPLWVLSFSKCSVGSGFQFNYGPVTTLVKVSPVLRRTLASPDRYGGAGQSGYTNMSTWWHCATATIGQLPFIATGLRSQERMCAVIKVIH